MKTEQLYELFLQNPQVCTDSRKVTKGCLFFALKGENFDGNKYIANAIESGASYAIGDDKELPDSANIIKVENVLKSLQLLSAYHRQQLGIPVIGITGTNGKTTTKELIGTVLSRKYAIGITEGNLNNHIGVPLTLLKMTKKTQIGVVEMGANHLHEIGELCQLSQPDYGIITNVGKAHLEGFGSFEGIRQTKGELYDWVAKNGKLVFYNADDNVLVEMINDRTGLQTISYGTKTQNVEILPSSAENPFLSFSIQNKTVKTQLVGNYNLPNVLAAITIGNYFDVELDDAIKAIENYQPQNNRSQLTQTAHNKLIVDAYNANPSSMEAAIRNFAAMDEKNKTLILGDMLELGENAEAEHLKIINLLRENKFEHVYLVGELFKKAAHNLNFTTFENTNQLADYLKTNPIHGQLILLKGSRGIALEKLMDIL